MRHGKNLFIFPVIATLILFLLISCERKLGWGVLLWANEKADIPSGTVLPVYIKSNIEKKWVAGIPDEYQNKDRQGKVKEKKIEIPLAELELTGSRGAAKKRAKEFGDYALTYAETMQNGLPVRESPDNSSPRVYRLRLGEVIKIMEAAEGTPAISAKGDPLPGKWYKVLTRDGTRGYCFSYRLSLFEHTSGSLRGNPVGPDRTEDLALESIRTKTWSPSIYNDMLNERMFNIEALSMHWGFSIGEDTGIANIYTKDIDKSFHYNSIRKAKDKAWRFEGTSLTMRQLNNDLISLQFIDDDGESKVLHFAALPISVDDLILQEKNRREELFNRIYKAGPEFSSITFGTLVFTENAGFLWEDFELLVPDYIPAAALGRGKAEIRYNISGNLREKFDAALSLSFVCIGGPDRLVTFLCKTGADEDPGQLTFEYAGSANIQDGIVVKEAAEPLIINFYSKNTGKL